MRAVSRERSPTFWMADFCRNLKRNTRDILHSGGTQTGGGADRQVVINEPCQSGFPVVRGCTSSQRVFHKMSTNSKPFSSLIITGKLQKPERLCPACLRLLVLQPETFRTNRLKGADGSGLVPEETPVQLLTPTKANVEKKK